MNLNPDVDNYRNKIRKAASKSNKEFIERMLEFDK